MEDLSQYGNSEVGRPYDAAKRDAIGGQYRNPYPVGSKASQAYDQGYQEMQRRQQMEDEVRRHSNR